MSAQPPLPVSLPAHCCLHHMHAYAMCMIHVCLCHVDVCIRACLCHVHDTCMHPGAPHDKPQIPVALLRRTANETSTIQPTATATADAYAAIWGVAWGTCGGDDMRCGCSCCACPTSGVAALPANAHYSNHCEWDCDAPYVRVQDECMIVEPLGALMDVR